MKTTNILLFITFLFFSFETSSQYHSSWRGPERNGHYPDKNLLREWPENGPEILWQYDELGEGYSSVTIENGKIYITGSEGEDGYVYVLNMNGEFLWKAKYGKAFVGPYPNTRTTPVVVSEKLYMFTGYGILVCMDSNNGDILWTLDTQNELDGVNIRWGVTENLIIDGEKLYCSVGGVVNNIIAVNRITGEVIWSSKGLGELSAYNSPLLINRGEKKILITMMANHILGIDAENGSVLWSHEHTNRFSIHPNTPIYDEDAIVCITGYGTGAVKLNLNDDGTKITQAWQNDTLESKMGGAVKIGNYLYGSGDRNRGWSCVDWETGETKYQDKSLANGVVITADNLLYIYSDRGELALVNPNPNSFDIIGKTTVESGTLQHWAHPVINDGKLYLRHGKSLIVYKIK